MFDEFLNHNDLNELLLAKEARRPFPSRAERDAWQKLPEQTRVELLAQGRDALQGYPALTATQFMAFVRSGERQIYEKPYFERRRKLIGAVLAECVADDGSFMDAVIDGLWCVCEESSWVISAHNGSSHEGVRPAWERMLPDVANPYIDLFAAQTAATLCYALYFLQDKLDTISPLIARRARGEVEKRIFHPFMTHDDFWWMGMIRRDVNNWTPWILSNIIDSMLLLIDDRIRLAEGLSRAMRMLDRYLAAVPPDGGCDEGCGYWNMAGGSLLDCLESLFLATGGRVDFYDRPLIRNIGAFPALAHIAGEYFWNFADCDARPVLDGERLYRFGMRTGNEALKALGKRVYAVHDAGKPIDTPQMNRILLSLFEGAQMQVAPDKEGNGRELPKHIHLPELQVYAWRQNGFYAAIKGGHNGENHNHNDVGSFLLYMDGEPHIVDAGNLVYTAKTFSEERYILWNTRSSYHNVPIIGGSEQHAGAKYAARNIETLPQGVRMELSSAYPVQAGVQGFVRTLAMREDDLILLDALTLDVAKSVTWVFLLRMKPECKAGIAAFGGLCMRFDSALQTKLEEIEITDERMKRSFPGSLWRLALTAMPCDSHNQVFTIVRR